MQDDSEIRTLYATAMFCLLTYVGVDVRLHKYQFCVLNLATHAYGRARNSLLYHVVFQRRARNSVSRSISRGREQSIVTDATHPNTKSWGEKGTDLTFTALRTRFFSFTRLAFPSLRTRPLEFHTFRSVHPPLSLSPRPSFRFSEGLVPN